MSSPIRQILPLGATIAVVTLSFSQGYPPDKAASKMTVPDGFRVELIAGEPLVRQPVAIDFDERGRLWVMQYLQYPNPAGLKRMKVDRFSRTVYDRVPDPPPRGPKGDDRLTIIEPDPGRPGGMKSHDFVSGLNIASAFAFGHGGVFVLQVPYLLFYPDRNRDDVPDGEPIVLLTGFGMEDAHSVANSLTWGPDGWLYGCQGSTVTANIRGIEFQQGVWRYHPLTHKFELFCEGGGNSWGLDFDRHGNLLYSTNLAPFTMLHGVQGGYYWKSFGKHGALHNPHAYGYFDHVPHADFRGGHVTVGGIVYRGDNFPQRFRDRYIAGDLLGHAVRWHEIEPNGSSFRSRNGGELLLANDNSFATSDVCLGPDGCVYVADWSDARTAHPDPDAEWDRSNGRIYRIAYGDPPKIRDLDLAKKSSAELVKLLSHQNEWYRRTARRILADRRDPEVILPLRTLVRESKVDDLALQALWALYVSGGFNESFGHELFGHRNEHIRRWAIRFLGDDERVSAETASEMARLAANDPSQVVRSQLACSARRLPAKQMLPIVMALIKRDVDKNDPHIPLLIWWAVERHSVSARAEVTKALAARDTWTSKLAQTALMPRLIRRYAAEGTPSTSDACATLIQSAPVDVRSELWESLELGLRDRPADAGSTEHLAAVLRECWDLKDPSLGRILARLGNTQAHDLLRASAWDRTRSVSARVAAVNALGESTSLKPQTDFLDLVMRDDSEPVRLAALTAWPHAGTDTEAGELTANYSKLPVTIRARARSVLLSRKTWAATLLRAVDAGRVPPTDFTSEDLFIVAAHQSKELDTLVRKHWGNIRSATPEDKLAVVRRYNNDLRAASGNIKNGQALFTKHCGACHKLNGEGGTLGPDLTHANRNDRDFLLVTLVDPSAVIRKEYLSYTAETQDNRVVTGIITGQTPTTVTLTNAKVEATTLKRDEIASLRESPVSLMPDGLLTPLKPQELRDLFAYLQQPSGKK